MRTARMFAGLMPFFAVICLPLLAQPAPIAINLPASMTWQVGRMIQPLCASGGTGIGQSWSITIGALPTGMALRPDLPARYLPAACSGFIAGVATAPGTYTFTLTVADSGGFTKSLPVTVSVTDLRIAMDSQLPFAYAGEAYDQTIITAGGSGGAINWTLNSSLPGGLSFDAVSGRISGTPTAPGNYNLSIGYTQGSTALQGNLNLQVEGFRFTTSRILPLGMVGQAYSATIYVAGGAAPYTFAWDCCNPGELSINASTGQITGVLNSESLFTMQVRVTDALGKVARRAFTLPVAKAPRNEVRIQDSDYVDGVTVGQSIAQSFWPSAGQPPYAWSVSAGALPVGVRLITNPAELRQWWPAGVPLVAGVPSVPGNYTFTLRVTDSSTPTPVSTERTFTLKVRGLSLEGLPNGIQGTPYSEKEIILGGNSANYSLQRLTGEWQYGLNLSGLVVSGTPQEAYYSGLWVTVSDGATSFEKPHGVYIEPANANPVTIDTGWDLGNWRLSTSNSLQIQARGGSGVFDWSVVAGSLPPGVTLNPGTAAQVTLSGTPTTAGVYRFAIQAQQPGATNRAIRQFELRVGGFWFTNGPGSILFVGTPVNFSYVVGGVHGSLQYSLTSGSLPIGLILSQAGSITGTPSMTGSYSFCVRVTDTANGVWDRTCPFINVYGPGVDPPLFISQWPGGTRAVNPQEFRLDASGGRPPYSFAFAPGTAAIPGMRIQNGEPLPDWYSPVKSSLLGIPSPGTFSGTLRVTDSLGRTADQPFSFTVIPIDIGLTRIPVSQINQAVNVVLPGVGGTPPYQFAVVLGALPAGVNLASDGTMSGAVSSAACYNFTLRVRDAANQEGTRNYSGCPSPVYLTTYPTRNLPNGVQNQIYPPTTLSVAGGTGPYNWSVASWSYLPPGLTLNSSTGLVSGTPTQVGQYGPYVIITDAVGNRFEATFSLPILSNGASVVSFSTSSALSDTAVGNYLEWNIFANGGTPPYGFAVEPGSTLPVGMLLQPGWGNGNFPNSALLMGAPRAPGDYNFSLRATDSLGNTVTAPFTVHVAGIDLWNQNMPLHEETAVVSTTYSRPLLAVGGTGTYSWAPIGTLPNGMSLSSAGVFSGTPTDTGNNYFQVRGTDGAGQTIVKPFWLNVSSPTGATLAINVGTLYSSIPKSSEYYVDLTASNSPAASPIYSFSIVGGSLPPGFSLLSGNQLVRTMDSSGRTISGAIAGATPATGTYTFVLRVTDQLGNIGQKQVKMQVTAISFLTASLFPIKIGKPYSRQFEVLGATGSIVFSATNLPPGLVLSPAGLLSGTPTVPGSYYTPVTVTDSTGDTCTRGFSLTVNQYEVLGSRILPTATYGTPYSYTFTTDMPGPLTWSLSSVPSGMTFNSATGQLSGTVVYSGGVNLYVSVSNGTSSISSQSFFLPSIYPPTVSTLQWGTVSLADAVIGRYQSWALSGYGGTPPHQVTLAPGSTLPAGLALRPYTDIYGGVSSYQTVLTGTPTVAGNHNFRLILADSAGLTQESTFTLAVLANYVSVSNATYNYSGSVGYKAAVLGQPFSHQLVGTGMGTSGYTFELADSVLCPGLSLSPTGLISGTPTNTGEAGFVIKVSNSGVSRLVSMSLRVTGADGKLLTINPTGWTTSYISLGDGVGTYLRPSNGAGVHTWSLLSGSLPTGLTLLTSGLPPGAPANSARIQGTTSAAGTYNYTLQVADGNGTVGVQTYPTVVTPLRIGPPNSKAGQTFVPPAARVGTPYSLQIPVTGGTAPYSFTRATTTGVLPAGLTLSSGGLLSGTPVNNGNSSIDMLITDAAGKTLRRSVSIAVLGLSEVNVPLFYDYLPAGGVGQAYDYALDDLIEPGRGIAPFTWTVVSGTVTPGLAITPGSGLASARLTGTPTIVGANSVTLRATDSVGNYYQTTATVPVSAMSISPMHPLLNSAIAGSPYSVTLTASGGTAPHTFSLQTNSGMPVGMTLNSAGSLSGTPTSVGVHSIAVTVTDASSASVSKSYYLNVLPQSASSTILTTTPASISLAYTLGNPPPAPIPIYLATSAGMISVTASSSGGTWLSVSPATSAAPAVINAFISPLGLAGGTYNGTITILSPAAANSPRVIPVTLSVSNAPCTYTLSATSATKSATGGPASLDITAGPACSWTATSDVSWMKLVSSGSGTGNGSVQFSLDPNGTPTERIGRLTVGGQTLVVTQFGQSCSFTFNPASASVTAAGGPGLISFTASNPGCNWSAAPSVSWIAPMGPTSGTGSGTLQISVAPNLGASRSGAVMIQGKSFTVDQTGAGCSYALSSLSDSVSSSGGYLSPFVQVSGSCAWTAISGVSWITVISGSPTYGNNFAVLFVSANSSTQARSASVVIAGKNYTVTQAGVPCSFSLSSTNPVQPAGGGFGTIAISSTGSGCSWVASSNANWITGSASSGSGPWNLTFTVAANPAPAARSGTITIAGQNVVVNQSGTTCSYDLRSPSATMPSTGGENFVGLVTASSCPWNVSSSDSFVTLNAGSASGTGAANITYTVTPNPNAIPRSATLTIQGQSYSVTQDGAPCQITLGSSSFAANAFSGTGSFTYTTSVSACAHEVMSYNSWLTITSKTYSGTNGTVNFSYDTNPVAAVRSGRITVGDRTFNVTQAASPCSYSLDTYQSDFSSGGGSGSVPFKSVPDACVPTVSVITPPGMISLGALTGSGGIFSQAFSVGLYQSFIPYIRSGQVVVNGLPHTVKQQSW